MSLYSKIDKYVLIPIADKIMHRSLAKIWRIYEANEQLSREQLTNLQNQKLQALIKHCYEHVPYYHRIMVERGLMPTDITCPQDLTKLPILTKQLVREHYNELISDDINQRRYTKESTGGSTGTPMPFLSDLDEWGACRASSFRAWRWYGFHLGEKMFTLGGNSLVKKSKYLTPKDIFDLYIMRNLKHSCAEVTDEAMQAHYEALMRYKPKVIRGYPSAIVYLAYYIERNNLSVCPLRCILTTAEILLPKYRETIERVFKCKVYDEYGAGDGGIKSHECELQNGLHISEEQCIIEIADAKGNLLPDGEIGYVLSTNLNNYVFPFVRYQVGDMAKMKMAQCTCGRASRCIDQIIGRVGKLIYNKQGVPVSSVIIDNMFFINCDYHDLQHCVVYNKMDKFQLRQDKNGDIKIFIKPQKKDEDIHTFDYVVDNVSRHFVGSEVSLEFVDDIPPMPSGKEDYCISEYEYSDTK
ncbi:MAG: phenylacetate--CoA ligase family protein [Prevotellaceae bacterium]|nr:phenylacetate--CoA ligase family protein [Candidatus Faecinaster equi]